MEGGKPENLEKNPWSKREHQRQTQLTYDTEHGIQYYQNRKFVCVKSGIFFVLKHYFGHKCLFRVTINTSDEHSISKNVLPAIRSACTRLDKLGSCLEPILSVTQ
jgi:hypothetical protein